MFLLLSFCLKCYYSFQSQCNNVNGNLVVNNLSLNNYWQWNTGCPSEQELLSLNGGLENAILNQCYEIIYDLGVTLYPDTEVDIYIDDQFYLYEPIQDYYINYHINSYELIETSYPDLEWDAQTCQDWKDDWDINVFELLPYVTQEEFFEYLFDIEEQDCEWIIENGAGWE